MPALSYSTVFFLGAASGWLGPALMWAVGGATLTWLVSAPRNDYVTRDDMSEALKEALERERISMAP